VIDGELVSLSKTAHVWFHTDYNSTVAIGLRPKLHGGAAGPSLTLNGSVEALSPGIGVQDLLIALRVSDTLGVSWDPIGNALTDGSGNFTISWTPSKGGNFLIEALWQNSTSAQHGLKIISLNLAKSSDGHAIVVESNSTIMGFNFSAANRSASFDVFGVDGSSGYARICIAKELAGNIRAINVTMDGVPVNCTIASEVGFWIVYFEYHHSMHKITTSMSDAAAPTNADVSPDHVDIQLAILFAVGAVLMFLMTILLVRRRGK